MRRAYAKMAEDSDFMRIYKRQSVFKDELMDMTKLLEGERKAAREMPSMTSLHLNNFIINDRWMTSPKLILSKLNARMRERVTEQILLNEILSGSVYDECEDEQIDRYIPQEGCICFICEESQYPFINQKDVTICLRCCTRTTFPSLTSGIKMHYHLGGKQVEHIMLLTHKPNPDPNSYYIKIKDEPVPLYQFCIPICDFIERDEMSENLFIKCAEALKKKNHTLLIGNNTFTALEDTEQIARKA